MRYVNYRVDDRWAVGELIEDGSINEVLCPDPSIGVLSIVEAADASALPRGGWRHVDDVELGAPFPQLRRNIFCVGKNYREHAAEFAGSGYDSGAAQVIPDLPIIFTKAPSTVCGPQSTVTVPRGLSEEVDYEAELAVVIGKPGRAIAKEQALEHVWGYTLLNDLTARDLQRDHEQWFLGKSPDDFAPMGPWAVTRDEIALDDTSLTCTVNGELRQKANTADLIFDVPTLIEVISKVLTLLPGDVIATGTPAGVGIGFDPPRFLADGDVVEISATALGTLRTRMRIE
jgi:2-keto-4-pentenoate hydratase/2-oxohepta-3-ene-1,7-dioic acid hydratase in catechol pathway